MSAHAKMQEDTFPAAEKILLDIENVLKKDSSVGSFEIIPADDSENKSPVYHQEECLGLESWCIQPLYCYTYHRLLEHRKNRHRREDPSNVARWLLGALLLNPQLSTFWNMRRELVRSHKLDAAEELSFTRLILYEKPNCFEAFAHRRWLLPYILDAKAKNYNPQAAESPLCTEINVANSCADRYANNYHAWSHRRYIMMLRESRGYTHPTFEAEWKSSLAWCQQHVSDYSGLVYRQFLLKKCILETSNMTKEKQERCSKILAYVSGFSYENFGKNDFTYHTLNLLHGKTVTNVVNRPELQACFKGLSYWIEEAIVNEDCIKMYDAHEALWCHRRYLAHLLLRLIESYRIYSTYKAEVIDDPREIRPWDDKRTNVQPILIDAFVNRTRKIVKLARKRDKNEKTIVERFLRSLNEYGIICIH